MNKPIRRFYAIIILIDVVWLIDLNVVWYKHPMNTVPVLKYTIIGLSIILFIVLVQILQQKKK